MKIIIAILLCSLHFSLHAQSQPEIYQNLSEKQQRIVPIASFTAQGKLNQLETALKDGLDAGLTINEIKEVLVHVNAYAGFPRSIIGLQTFMHVLDERADEGTHDEWGREASPIDNERNKYERGTDILGELTGLPPEAFRGGYAAFAPEIEVFLKEHLFADLFERDVLTHAERQLATISIISSLDGLSPMLRGHFNISLNTGLEPAQLYDFVQIIEFTAGKEQANAAQEVLVEVIENR